MKLNNLLYIILSTVFPHLCLSTGLHGTYTIGGKSPDFKSFRAAVKALNDSGVSAAVVFNVRDGHYSESVRIDSIKGASLSNTVTFQGESHDSMKVVLDTNWVFNSLFNATLLFYHASFVTFKYITINNLNSASLSVNQVGECDYDILSNLYFKFGGIAWGDSSANCKIINNSFVHQALTSIGGRQFRDSSSCYNLEIAGNIFDSTYIGASSAATEISIHNNLFIIDTMGDAGIVAIDGLLSGNIYSNKFYAGRSPMEGAGILLINSGTKKNKLYIYNNFIFLNSGGEGIWLSKDTNIYIYNNSIAVRGGKWSSCVGTDQSQYQAYNNIYAVDSGDAVYDDYTTRPVKSDYNAFYAYYFSAPNIKDRQSHGLDKHSFVADPEFISDTNLHTYSPNLKGKAIPISIVKTDIDGELRNPTRPDIGADEFGFIPQHDLGIEKLLLPSNHSCRKDSNKVGFVVKNYGASIESGFKIAIKRSGASIDSLTYLFKDTLVQKQDTVIYTGFKTPWNIRTGGTFSISGFTELSSDSNHSNDTSKSTITIFPLPKASFSSQGACLGQAVNFMDSSTSHSQQHWYFGDGNLSKLKTPLNYYSSIGKFEVSLAIKDSNQCYDSTSKTVYIDSIPDARWMASWLATKSYSFKALDSLSKTNLYLWNFGDGFSANIPSATHNFTKDTIYKIELKATSLHGCVNTYDSTLNLYTGLLTIEASSVIRFFPNPATNTLHIENRGPVVLQNIVVMDIEGRTLKAFQFLETWKASQELDISNLAKGMYLLRLQTKEGIEVKRFVKE